MIFTLLHLGQLTRLTSCLTLDLFLPLTPQWEMEVVLCAHSLCFMFNEPKPRLVLYFFLQCYNYNM